MRLNIDEDHQTPDKDSDNPDLDFAKKIKAAAAAADMLVAMGLEEAEPDEEDRVNAAAMATAYAQDPFGTTEIATSAKIAASTPASLQLTRGILDEFGHQIVESSTKVRHMVVNKLINETENPDPRIRIRALEMLGKMTDVGLFTEKSEVTVTHQTSDDLREKLREKLSRLKDVTPKEPVDVEFESDA